MSVPEARVVAPAKVVAKLKSTCPGPVPSHKAKVSRSERVSVTQKLRNLDEALGECPGALQEEHVGSLCVEVSDECFKWVSSLSESQFREHAARAIELLPGRYFKMGELPKSLELMAKDDDSWPQSGMAVWRQGPRSSPGANDQQLWLFWSPKDLCWYFSKTLNLSGEGVFLHQTTVAWAHVAKQPDHARFWPDNVHVPSWSAETLEEAAKIDSGTPFISVQPYETWAEQQLVNKPVLSDDPEQVAGKNMKGVDKNPKRGGWLERAATLVGLYKEAKYDELDAYIKQLSGRHWLFNQAVADVTSTPASGSSAP